MTAKVNYQTLDTRWGDGRSAAPPEEFVGTKGAAHYLCVNEKFLYTLRKQRNGPAYEKRGRKILYTLVSLQEWRKGQMFAA